jgi:hypothetical protein
MKILKPILLIFFFPLLAMTHASTQKEYIPVSTEDGVEFSYLWKRSRVIKKDSPMILFLKIHNSNAYHASVDFTVDYFWNGIRSASSDPNSLCIKAGKTAKGRMKNLTFQKTGYSDQEISSVNFTLDLSDVTITEVETCRKNKN